MTASRFREAEMHLCDKTGTPRLLQLVRLLSTAKVGFARAAAAL